MSREILFRGKCINNDGWVYGHFYETRGNGKNVHRIYDGNIFKHYTVHLETVGQFTGLTDKNGKRIFEGDIVKYGDTVHEVVFEQRNGTAYFGLVYSPLETLPFGHYQDLRQIEIIGNVHDNPELLK